MAIWSQGPEFFPNSWRRFLTNTLYFSFRTKASQSIINIHIGFLEKQVMWPPQLVWTAEIYCGPTVITILEIWQRWWASGFFPSGRLLDEAFSFPGLQMIEKVEDARLFVKQHHFRSDKCTLESLQILNSFKSQMPPLHLIKIRDCNTT